MNQQIRNDMETAQNIGEQFLKAYFGQGADISKFYGNDSILTFESDVFIGNQEIMGKLSSLPVKVEPNNYSIQPSNNGILMYVSGFLTVSGETNKNPFTRVIFLANVNGSYYIKNDIYKVSFG